jgi:hypothetical protein
MVSETQKVAILAFKGEPMCFVHAMLNALDMAGRGMDVKVIMEGPACGLIDELEKPEAKFADLYAKVRQAGLIDAVCQACAHQMGALEAARRQELPIVSDMSGHPPMAEYVQRGYQIVTF